MMSDLHKIVSNMFIHLLLYLDLFKISTAQTFEKHYSTGPRFTIKYYDKS